MNPVKNNIVDSPSEKPAENSKEKIRQNNSDKFDLSIIGKIDLVEAEKIASEEVIFLTEDDLIEGLEDFELVPVKGFKESSNFIEEKKIDQSEIVINEESNLKRNDSIKETVIKVPIIEISEDPVIEKNQNIDLIENATEIPDKDIEDFTNDNKTDNHVFENNDIVVEITDDIVELKNDSDGSLGVIDKTDLPENDLTEKNLETTDDVPAKKLFTVKINEETLDAQLSSILYNENIKTDDKITDKFDDLELVSKCRFVDDQFCIKPELEDNVTYNEDPLTERLVKMIEVADGKLEILETITKDDLYSNYILEDYTLYSSEKFDTVFKEEIFYSDSDFEFIDNAIIRDDFTKYIHEIDDYFESEESLIQSEISEILGLIPDENNYIEDKLFGDYYKKYDLDNEIDFIKPEIDFFRSNYTGIKNLSYFTESEKSILESEKKSIEEDISSPNAIVFEEDISEIENILKRDYDYNWNNSDDIEINDNKIILSEEFPDITDNIIILDDKEKIMELVSEYPEKHENLIRLLSYLDGLFEKLPEEVIRKFAESEYFELYSKVLKEMGV